MLNALLSTLDLFNYMNEYNCIDKKENNDKIFNRIESSCKSKQIISQLTHLFPHLNCMVAIVGDGEAYNFYFLSKNYAVYDSLIHILNTLSLSLYTISWNKPVDNDTNKINKRKLTFYLTIINFFYLRFGSERWSAIISVVTILFALCNCSYYILVCRNRIRAHSHCLRISIAIYLSESR